MSSWLVALAGALALGPATAQVERSAVTSPVAVAAAPAKPPPVPQARVKATPMVAAQVQVASALTGFEGYKSWLAGRARREGVRDGTIRATIPYLRLNGRVMELDRGQRPSAPTGYVYPLAPYLQRHVTPSLIARGQARYSAHWPNLTRIHARYGVDPAVLMAIYGKETSYGTVTGSFDLLEALASLAYEGRRRDFFEGEFLATLKLIDQGVPRSRLRGSYAGATGYPQFMPSVVLRLRADGNGDGYADIWNSEVDALASIANYLRDAGWKRDVPWAIAVRVPHMLNRAAIRSTVRAPRCPRVFERHSRWLTMREWRALGVTPVGRTIPETELATLMEPNGQGQGGYLLTGNYRAILDYNCSNFYAMSVGLLSDAIARR